MADNSKKKQVTLTFLEKRQILEKLDLGITNRDILKNYKIGRSTLFYIKKNRQEILNAALVSEKKRLIKRKTLHGPKQVEFDRILYEWVLSKQSQGAPLSGPMLVAKARSLKEELKITVDMKFSQGWLRSFKSRHGLQHLKIPSEQRPADTFTGSTYCEKFQKIIEDYALTPDNIYIADNTGMNWKCLPTEVFVGLEKEKMKGIEFNKERLSIMLCFNASGTHKLKLLVVGTSEHPKALKEISPLPVCYYSSKNGLINQHLFTEWFQQEFVPAVQKRSYELGKCDSKCLLLIDHYQMHPHETKLVSPCGNVFACYLPPNMRSVVQPTDQGVIWNLKCLYRNDFMLNLINSNTSIEEFQSNFTIKDAIFTLASVWNQVQMETLINTWGDLFLASSVPEKEAETESGIEIILGTVRLSTKHAVLQSLNAKEIKTWMQQDERSTEQCSEEDKDLEISDSSSHFDESSSEHSNEEISWDDAERSMETVIRFLERNAYFNDNNVLQAMSLQNDIIIKRMLHQEIVGIRNRLKNLMANPVSCLTLEKTQQPKNHFVNETFQIEDFSSSQHLNTI